MTNDQRNGRMHRKRYVAVLVALAVGAGALWIWSARPSTEQREIHRRLDEFTATFNAASGEGLGGLAQAARLGHFFTDDVVVELGRGSPPIRGRETVVGMAARLQPRAAEFLLEFVDVTIGGIEEERAEVSLTAVLRRRAAVPAPESLDAREFSAELAKVDGVWQVSRVVAIDPVR
jgi:hypothetical protein